MDMTYTYAIIWKTLFTKHFVNIVTYILILEGASRCSLGYISYLYYTSMIALYDCNQILN